MTGLATKQQRRSKRARARIGRPPKELAHEVDERILDAARRVFLTRGLARASINEIARLAHAGKPSIYARYASKEDLFAAVAIRNATNIKAGISDSARAGTTLAERLTCLGGDVLAHLLDGDTVAFMRLSMAEVDSFPDLPRVGRMARQQGAKAVAEVLSAVAGSNEIASVPAFAPERAATTAQFFLDLVIGPALMRAFLGEDLDQLRKEIAAHVALSVKFFLAACLNGGAD
ncbi:TetR/AcrR family transcriptional regulator [Mesorhizobium sp. B2-3-3]|nr:TetR/AcrR family transcriptional regulator [Mesorhizobium sp. B2-3-3]